MKIFQLYYPEERIKLPKEDAWAVDRKSNTFAVADGVHLVKGIEYEKKYPRPSPAGKLAQKFCDNFLKFSHGKSIEKAFAEANRSVFSINKGRNKYKTFLTAQAYFAATGAFGRIKNNILEWGNICDSGVVVINGRSEITMWKLDHRHHGSSDILMKGYSPVDRTYMFRTTFRNALSPQGEKWGYGVITGEPAAEAYAYLGKRKLHKGDLVVFISDGFEEYLKEKSFRVALRTMNKKVIEQTMVRLKRSHKGDAEFVSERTLLSILID